MKKEVEKMKIQVLGSGCAKCSRLEKNVKEALKIKGMDATVEKVSDMNRIMEMGVMITPGLVIDGRIVSSGKVPSADDIASIL